MFEPTIYCRDPIMFFIELIIWHPSVFIIHTMLIILGIIKFIEEWKKEVEEDREKKNKESKDKVEG